MRKLQGIILSLLMIATVTGCAKTDTKSVKKNGLDQGVSAVQDAMSQKRSDNTTNDTQKTKELREGTSKDTVKTPKDFPSKYNYGTGKISDYKRSDMLRKMPKPKNNETVLRTKADSQKIQALYLWEKDNVPSVTNFTKDMTGYFDSWNFRPYVTAIPVKKNVKPKGAVVLMAGGAYQFR